MKELKIELNKSGRLKNKYDNVIKIGRNSKGCFIVTESMKCGPFERIFIDKAPNGDELIIGYTPSETEFYRVNPRGINLDKQIKVSIEDLTDSKKKEISFEGCELIGSVNGHSIFFNKEEGLFFAVNTLKEIKDVNEYKMFDSYEELTDYYKENNIDLHSKEIQSKANTYKKVLINFDNLYAFVNNLRVSDLNDEILFDIVAGRNTLKKIYSLARPAFIQEVKTERKYNTLIEQGYEEIKNTSYETVSKNKTEEISKYIYLVEDKLFDLKDKCISTIKKNNPLDFNKLADYLRKVTIVEIPSGAQRELSAKRPLTRQIFLGIITAGLDRMKLEGIDVSEYYYSLTNISSVYPEEVEKLREIALERLPELYDQYFEERAKKRPI